MSNLNLKGIWIPVEILTDKKLSDKEKTIYAIIIYLSKEKQYLICRHCLFDCYYSTVPFVLTNGEALEKSNV